MNSCGPNPTQLLRTLGTLLEAADECTEYRTKLVIILVAKETY